MLFVLLVFAVVFAVVYQEIIYHCITFLVFAVISDCGLSFERVSLQNACGLCSGWALFLLSQVLPLHCFWSLRRFRASVINVERIVAISFLWSLQRLVRPLIRSAFYCCNIFYGLCSGLPFCLLVRRLPLQYVFGLCSGCLKSLAETEIPLQYVFGLCSS